ncbi:MAG: glycosyltransferase family 2 protein [Candidatus Thorarchaeota archaeon]|jgi:glycosyltransferase involved in cell wall biosynthesis
MARVSVIIPGRCEQYFQATIDSTLENATGDVEIIPVVDGMHGRCRDGITDADPKIEVKDDRVKPIFLDESVGQRAAYNLGVEKSTGDYIMKIDAHAIPAPGFDTELANTCPEKGAILPTMCRLDRHKWKVKPRGKTYYMYFGSDCYTHFWREYGKRPEAKGNIVETMAGQGSCWFWSRKWHDYVEGLDEACGSWGMVGIETTLKTWLCGGTLLVNKNTWQAHWFRRKDGGFTYPMSGRNVAKAHNYCRNNWFHNDNAFRHQVRPFRWVLDKFAPVPTWEFSYLDKGTPQGKLVDDFHFMF